MIRSLLPPRLGIGLALLAGAAVGCSKPQPQAATAPPLQPAAVTPTTASAASPYAAAATPAVAPSPYAAASADSNAPPPPPPANGYSCSFPGPNGRAILARFSLDPGGAQAHDDQGLAFTVLANSPTALVLAHPRDNVGLAPDGDVGAYLVAIDRRTLGMVQSTVGLHGRDASRNGRCIAG